MKCPQVNVSKTKTYIFSEKNNSNGWHKYCLINPFIENGPLDIICDIQIIELNNCLVFKETQMENKDTDKIDEKKEEINNKEISKLHEQMIQTLQNDKETMQKKIRRNHTSKTNKNIIITKREWNITK
eukprot:186953_1